MATDPKDSSRAWCFTINNFTEADQQQVDALKYVYLVYSYEEGEETHTKHIQGYVYFKDAKTMSATKKLLKRAHLEIAGGEAIYSRVYVIGPWSGIDKRTGLPKSKPYNPNYKELGVMPKQGKRNDLAEVKKELKENPKMRHIVDTARSFQSIRMAEVYLKYKETERSFKPKVYWLYGATGTGKSHDAQKICDPDDTYNSMDTGKWFEGYDAHKYVIIDDVRSDFMTYARWLKFMDRYGFRVETKGGSRQFLAEVIIFTCNKSPVDCITADRILHEDPNQFLDRIDCIVNYSGDSFRRKKNAVNTIEIEKGAELFVAFGGAERIRGP